MLERDRDNWKLLKDKLEIGIVKKYSYFAKVLTISLMGKNNIITLYVFIIDEIKNCWNIYLIFCFKFFTSSNINFSQAYAFLD